MEERLRFLTDGVAPRRNVDVMKEAIAEAAAEAPVEKKKKKKDKKEKTYDHLQSKGTYKVRVHTK